MSSDAAMGHGQGTLIVAPPRRIVWDTFKPFESASTVRRLLQSFD